MTSIESHPSVLAVRNRTENPTTNQLDFVELKAWCMEAGADDVGFVSIGRNELDAERDDILRVFPATKMLISFVCRMNADSVRSPARNLANHEFHETGDVVNETARRIVEKLRERGIRAVNPPMAFPMEMDRFPGKMWAISLKPLAVAAGLGQMGIHRNVIHPKFGNFILLGVVLCETDVTENSKPIEYNPCLGCKLCVAACPVGAISPSGDFNFSSCYAHNYREFMSGFTDWVENVADSKSAVSYRTKVTDSESVSMWQSLAFGPNYKAAYCLAVCPAGEDVLSPFLNDRSSFLSTIVKPLQQKEETLYVQPNSDAEEYAHRRFPHKKTKRIGAVLRPVSIDGFIKLMKHGFQPGRSKGLSAKYHFRFTGPESRSATVEIKDGKIAVQEGLVGDCDLRVTASSSAWLKMLRKETSVGWLLGTFQIRLWGDPRLLVAFGKCFP
ncbi:MAG: SCP2 sterol-binding domain-containing protein [Pirellula sp.]|nr:SCP2 sterol-binding domain-containing protein [Pirellula sp.]